MSASCLAEHTAEHKVLCWSRLVVAFYADCYACVIVWCNSVLNPGSIPRKRDHSAIATMEEIHTPSILQM